MTKILVPAAWTFWGIDVLVILVGIIFNERGSDQFKPVARAALLILLGGLAGAAALLSWAVRTHSDRWLSGLSYSLGLPALFLVYGLGAEAVTPWLRQRDDAKTGSFRNPALQQLVAAIVQGDMNAFMRILDTKPNLQGKDRAGNDILTYAATCVRDQDHRVEPVRLLLEAGCDPNANRDLLTFMVMEARPASQEIARLLLQHGADPNAFDPDAGDYPIHHCYYSVDTLRELIAHGAEINLRNRRDGTSAITQCMIARNWDAAVYLVEHGADLDIPNPQGGTFNYYLNNWAPSVFPDPPEGLQRLRAAVALRREADRAPAAN